MSSIPADDGGEVHPDLALAMGLGEAIEVLPGVARLHDSPPHAFGTWRRGRRQAGVRVTGTRPPDVQVRVVAASPDALADLGDEVRAAVRAYADGLGRVDVHIKDVDILAGRALAADT